MALNNINKFINVFSVNKVSVSTLKRCISEKSTILTSAENYSISTKRDITICILSMLSFGIVAIADACYRQYAASEKRNHIALIADFIGKIDKSTISDSDPLIIPSPDGEIVVEKVSVFGVDKIRITMNEEVEYIEGLTTIESFIDHFIFDMIIHYDIYAEMGVKYVPNPSNTRSAIKLDIDRLKGCNITSSEKQSDKTISEVTKLTYSNGETYFFKPSKPPDNIGHAADISSIPQNPELTNLHYRSMYTYVMNNVLDFDVVPETGFTSDENGISGYIQKKATGEEAYSILKNLKDQRQLDSLKSNPDIVRKMVELQLLDALTGQADRHCNNYFIDLINNKVYGIDNDVCGGMNVAHPHTMVTTYRNDGYLHNNLTMFETNAIKSLQQNSLPSPPPLIQIKKFLLENPLGVYSVFLPPVMDTNMVQKFTNLNYGQLVDIMSQLHFTVPEIKAAFSRLDAIKFHISVLEQRKANGVHSIIDPIEWSTPETQVRMYTKNVVGNALLAYTNYLDRDMGIAENKINYKPPDWTNNKTRNAADIVSMTNDNYASAFPDLRRYK